MNGKLKDWSFSRTGESVLTITTRESCKKLWDALGDQEITFSIKRRVIPRSLNANNYAWSLIEKLAVAVKSDKDSVYEEMLRRYGTGETYTDEAGNECKVLFSLREGVPPRWWRGTTPKPASVMSRGRSSFITGRSKAPANIPRKK